MPGSPTAGALHVDQLLTDLSVAFVQNPAGFVAPTVFPPVDVTKQSNKVRTYNRGDFNRDTMQIRQPGTESAGGGFRVSTVTYVCDKFALHKDIDLDEAANDDLGSLPMDTAKYLAQQALIKQEVDWASTYFTTGIWGTDRTGGTDFAVWTDVASSPIDYLRTQCAVIEAATGMWPTDLTLNRTGWNALVDHPDVVDRVKGAADPNRPAIVSRASVAALLELERVNVSTAVKTTTQEGLSDTLGYVCGNHALLTYRPASPGLLTPSAGYTFRWSGGGTSGMTIQTIDAPLLNSTRYEINAYWDQKVMSTVLGVFLSGVA